MYKEKETRQKKITSKYSLIKTYLKKNSKIRRDVFLRINPSFTPHTRFAANVIWLCFFRARKFQISFLI